MNALKSFFLSIKKFDINSKKLLAVVGEEKAQKQVKRQALLHDKPCQDRFANTIVFKGRQWQEKQVLS